MQTGNLQHQYDLWSQVIEDTTKKVGKITKKNDTSHRKNTKSAIKENITAASNNTFNWIFNGDRYMASKGEN